MYLPYLKPCPKNSLFAFKLFLFWKIFCCMKPVTVLPLMSIFELRLNYVCLVNIWSTSCCVALLNMFIIYIGSFNKTWFVFCRIMTWGKSSMYIVILIDLYFCHILPPLKALIFGNSHLQSCKILESQFCVKMIFLMLFVRGFSPKIGENCEKHQFWPNHGETELHSVCWSQPGGYAE